MDAIDESMDLYVANAYAAFGRGLMCGTIRATANLDTKVQNVVRCNFELTGCSHAGRYHEPGQSEWDKAMDHVIEANNQYADENNPNAARELFSAGVHIFSHVFGESDEREIDPNTPNEGIGTG